jgi:hypothetical protein
MFIIISYKPKILFEENGNLRRFGVSKSKNETPIDLLVLIVVVCFFITFLFSILKLYFKK